MKKYLIFDLDWTLIKSSNICMNQFLHCVKKVNKECLEKAKYIFTTTPWMNVYDQLKITFDWKHINDSQIKKIWDKIYKRIRNKEDKIWYFEWVPKKIIELSKKYKLFLTTWNSTKFAKDILKKWEIKDCFELIYWSDEIKKWKQHLEIFKNYSENENFYNESVYIWDWDMDKYFATESWIDFIRIWNFEENDNPIIESVLEIENVLQKYK